MSKKNIDIALWLSLIIGKVAAAKAMRQREAFVYLRETGALGYLVRNYDVEHLENPLNVLDDIDQFIIANNHALV
jgi:hypothetical protein